MLEDLLSEAATALGHTGEHATRVGKLTCAHEARVLLGREGHVVLPVLRRAELRAGVRLHVVGVGRCPVHFIGILLRSIAFHTLMPRLIARIPPREERIVAQLLGQFLHVPIVVENAWVLRNSTRVLGRLRVLARGVSVGVRGKRVLVRVREAASIPVIELTTWAQRCNVVPLDVFHFEVWAGGVGRQEPCSIPLLLLMLLIEKQHLKHVLSVDQLVL